MSKLGQGAYGSVTKHKNLAVKKFARLSHIIQEQSALFYLNDCDYVVHTKDVDYNKLELSMELYDMSLRKWIGSNECQCEDCKNNILHDILQGLVELQDRGLSHSDLKPGNVLINKEPFKAVLGDCGFVSIAKYSKQARTAQSHRDLVIEHDDKHDMFSFAVIMLELLYYVRPSVKETYKEYQNIVKRKVTNKIHLSLLKNLLSENRTLRPCAREVLNLLYKENPRQWTVNKITNFDTIVDTVCKKYGKQNMKSLELVLKNNRNLEVNRTRRGYIALLVFLYHHDIGVGQLECHFIAMLIILASTFSSRSADINHINAICKIKYNKKKLNEIIYTMTNDKNFINVIFS